MEIIIEFIIQRLIVGFFGYYTLLLFFKIFNNNKGVKWLDESLDNEGEEFGRGCMIGIVGLLSFTSFVMILLHLINSLFY